MKTEYNKIKINRFGVAEWLVYAGAVILSFGTVWIFKVIIQKAIHDAIKTDWNE